MITYRNPLPVVIVAIPVLVNPPNPERGILAIRRANEPDEGALALVSGYIDYEELWQQAAIRELKEEIGLEMRAQDLSLMNVYSSEDKSHLLICCKTTCILDVELEDLILEPEEVSEVKIILDSNKLKWKTRQLPGGQAPGFSCHDSYKKIAEEILSG